MDRKFCSKTWSGFGTDYEFPANGRQAELPDSACNQAKPVAPGCAIDFTNGVLPAAAEPFSFHNQAQEAVDYQNRRPNR